MPAHVRGLALVIRARPEPGSVQAIPVQPPSWMAAKDTADVFIIQPRSRKLESHADAAAALEEAVSLVRAIPRWRVVGEAERARSPESGAPHDERTGLTRHGTHAGTEVLSAKESRSIFGTGQLAGVVESMAAIQEAARVLQVAARSRGKHESPSSKSPPPQSMFHVFQRSRHSNRTELYAIYSQIKLKRNDIQHCTPSLRVFPT